MSVLVKWSEGRPGTRMMVYDSRDQSNKDFTVDISPNGNDGSLDWMGQNP